MVEHGARGLTQQTNVRLLLGMTSTAIRFRRFGTKKQFMDHPHGACEITIGLAVFWTSTPVFHRVRDYHRFSLAVLTPVSHKVEERMAQGLHCNLVLLIHAPKVQVKASPGKFLVIGEPNITKEHDGKVKTTDALFSRMVKMIKSVHKKAVWVNHQRTERNGSGHCLALVLEWMVDLVIGGVSKLAIARNGQPHIHIPASACIVKRAEENPST
ncbi:hypothetical protein B0H14DRAFT_2602030 [Mycena olivaceomarginata]|nr:hypothetical protein B0H14DRAFT_2602030 [Mycena olivaceomarginata]